MGVPRGTTGLSVEYPPELDPPRSLGAVLLDAFLGPVVLMIAAGAGFAWFWSIARGHAWLTDAYLYTAIGFTAAMYALDIMLTYTSEGWEEVFWMLTWDREYIRASWRAGRGR